MPRDYAWVFVMGGLIVATIFIMAAFFIFKAVKRAKEIGMDMGKIKTAVKTSAIFSIVPSIPIVIGVGIMMSYLGLAIPWIRLTVIGALQYELIAMDQAGLSTAPAITDRMVATALVIMTVSIMSGPVFNMIAYKKYNKKLMDLQRNNKRLLDMITGSLLGGILAGLASYIIISAFFTGKASGGANGYITLITLFISMFIMALFGLLIKKFKFKKLEDYALPTTILISMAAAYGFTYVF
jgi:hypothetical protein